MSNSAKGEEGVWHGFEWVRVICGALVWVFSSSASQQQAVVFLCQTLCQRRNMRAVSVSVSGKGQSPSVKCLHCGAVAASETWHTADRAASSALQGLRVGSTKERIYLLLYSSFPLTLWLTLLWRVIWGTERWSVQHQGN